MNYKLRKITNLFAVLFACGVLMAFLHTQGKVILKGFFVYYVLLIPTVLMVEIVRMRDVYPKEEDERDSNTVVGIILYVFLLLVLVSSLNNQRWFYFLKWGYLGGPGFSFLESGIIQFILLTQFFTLLFLFPRKSTTLISAMVLVGVQILCLYVFLSGTGGEPLFKDDHPCFIYRVWEFAKTFPQLINYNPDWNAGVIDYSPVETGAISLGLLFWPIWKIFGVLAAYTSVYGVLFIVVIPFLYVLSLRIIGGNWISACAAGVLSLGVSQFYFLWLLNFGTPGACLSSAFIVPFSACVFRVLWLDKREWWLGVMLVLSGFFLVMWPPGIVMGLGVLLALGLNYRQCSRDKMFFLVVCLLAFLVIYFKVLAIIARPSTVGDVAGNISSGTGSPALFFDKNVLVCALKEIRGHLTGGNPLLVVFGLGGLFFLPYSGVKQWYMPILLFLMFFAGWGDFVSKELQFVRMGVPMFFVLIVPTSMWIGWFLTKKNMRFSIAQAGLIALLVLTGTNCMQIYRNQGVVRFWTIPDDIQELTGWIRDNTSKEGRILFAGSTIHEYGGGHAVVLPYLTDRAMLAADYVQFSTSGPQDYFPPSEFRAEKEKLSQYMDLYNITHVIAWEDDWKKIFTQYPDMYKEVKKVNEMSVYSVDRRPSYVLKGDATVSADFNVINVHTEKPSEEIVIKFNCLDGLKTGKPAELFSYNAGNGIKFIGIHPNGCKDIRISYKLSLIEILAQ